MDTFGDQLRREREQREVDLDEIARSTKIRVRYLRALEDGQHERLPGIVFAKGYVRAYAETIGADPDRLVRAYVDEQRSLGRLNTETSQEGVLEALAAAVDRDRRPAGRGKWFAIGATVLVGAAVLWFGIRALVDDSPATITGPAETTPLNAGAVPPVAPKTEPDAATAPIDTMESPAVSHPVSTPEPEPATTAIPRSPAAQDPPAPKETASVVTERTEPVREPIARPQPVPVQPEIDPAAEVYVDSTLTVSDYGVGSGVRQRELAGRASEFDAGTRVVFWTRVLGGARGRKVRHVWSHEGSVIGTVPLSIGGSHWRTYSRRTVNRRGAWSVEVLDGNGQVLAQESFVVR